MKLNFAAASALLLLPFVVACSDDKPTQPATDRITVAPEVAATTLAAGATQTIGITVTRPVGYTGILALTVENLPGGVTGVLTPATLQPEQSVSSLALSANAGAPTGNGTITIRASGTSLQSQSAAINVSVGTATPGSFTLSVSPSVVSVPKGGTTSAIVSIDRIGGFTGAVSLSISGFPAGILATLTPATISAGIGTINIAVDNTVAGGSYTATIIADGAGVASQSANFTVTIIPAIRQ